MSQYKYKKVNKGNRTICDEIRRRNEYATQPLSEKGVSTTDRCHVEDIVKSNIHLQINYYFKILY